MKRLLIATTVLALACSMVLAAGAAFAKTESKVVYVRVGSTVKLRMTVCGDGGYNLFLARVINGQKVKLVDTYPVLDPPFICGHFADDVWVYKALSPGYAWLTFEERQQWVKNVPAANVTNWTIVILPTGSDRVPSPFPGAPAQRIPPGTVIY